jgi:hypothetical protein
MGSRDRFNPSWADGRSYTDKVEELIHQVSFLSSRITKLENQLNNRSHSQPKKRRPKSSVRKPLVGILDKKESNESVQILSPNTNDIQ